MQQLPIPAASKPRSDGILISAGGTGLINVRPYFGNLNRGIEFAVSQGLTQPMLFPS